MERRERVIELVQHLREVVKELEEMFPERRFTLDGHLVGSIGECLAQSEYDLELLPTGHSTHDAISQGKHVQIKVTQGDRIGIRHKPDLLLVLKINAGGNLEEVYNGTGELVWKLVEGKPRPSNGQFQVRLNKLQPLSPPPDTRIPRRLNP